MKTSELRQMNSDALNRELIGLRKAQFSLRMQVATQQLSDTSQISKLKKDVARVKTIQHEKAVRK